MLNQSQDLFLKVSLCFCLFAEFAKEFERQVSRLGVAYLHTFKSKSVVFNCQQILTKICLVVSCGEMLQQFWPTPKKY